MNKIDIAKDFSDTPLGRYAADGEFSGERFRDEVLLPKLSIGPVEVVIDGVEGYGSSFLEEAFGGLVRKGHFSEQDLKKRLKVIFDDREFQVYETLIWKYIREAMSVSSRG